MKHFFLTNICKTQQAAAKQHILNQQDYPTKFIFLVKLRHSYIHTLPVRFAFTDYRHPFPCLVGKQIWTFHPLTSFPSNQSSQCQTGDGATTAAVGRVVEEWDSETKAKRDDADADMPKETETRFLLVTSSPLMMATPMMSLWHSATKALIGVPS